MDIIDNSVIKINIDGIEFNTKKNVKIIEIADEVGIYIPRFCYHKKLSIAANCRMCLVEVEKSPKLLPACATPVTDGMKIYTNTEKVIDAQRSIMEFLLINHPLDCPICDQGGECELQDLAVGYGCSSSRFIEQKRSFEDYDLGPLVATDVTRCILCSRCVRFCSEIAGSEDIGIINRGSDSRIFTFLQRNLKTELSGNVIDLCPVGALTSKPARFKFRPWELMQNSFVSVHDCIGSNIYVHVFKDKIIRIVPRKNDSINETWISDRDRFSYEGLYNNDKLMFPMIKKNNEWFKSSWDDALSLICTKLNEIKNKFGSENICGLISPNSTLEELYIFQKLLRSLGSNNIDHRIKQLDFRNQDDFPLIPGLDISLAEIDNMDAVLLIGSDIVREQPIIGIKLRKIANNGGKIIVINPIDFDMSINFSEKIIINPKNFITILVDILKNIKIKLNYNNSDLSEKIEANELYNNIINILLNSKKKLIILGTSIILNPDYSRILSLSLDLSKIIKSNFGLLTDGANSSGAWITGCVPNRLPSGINLKDKSGINIFDFFKKKLKAYLNYGLEIEQDLLYAKEAYDAMKNAEFVVSFSSFKNKNLLEISHVLLPIASSYEISGSYINVSGILQSFQSVIPTDYETKQGWQIINQLGNILKYSGFNYSSSEEILKDIKIRCNLINKIKWENIPINDIKTNIPDDVIIFPIISHYSNDSLVRRAISLQKTYTKTKNIIKVNSETYNNLKLKNNFVKINNKETEFFVSVDNTLSTNIAVIENFSINDNRDLEGIYEKILIQKI